MMDAKSPLSCARPGFVLSDLHLFTGRSEGEALMSGCEPELEASEVLVLNGDIFDFRWSTLGGHEASLAAATAWLDALMDRFRGLEIHYLLGNHDCLEAFLPQLAKRASEYSRFHWHTDTLQLGSWLFLHGDCANGKMDEAAFSAHRAGWHFDRPRGRVAAGMYRAVDALGFTRLTHDLYFPRRKTVRRITHYLDRTQPGWRGCTRNCCFGHSHRPFQGFMDQGMAFHNTGSAIRGMGFQPMVFDAAQMP